MKYILILILLCCFTTTFSQPTFSDFYRVDSAETINTTFYDLLVKSDGYYLLGSKRDYLSFPDEAMLMKLDTNGQMLWVKDGDTIQNINWRYRDILDTQNGYMAIPARNSDGTSSLLFIDFNGEIIHKKDYISMIADNRITIKSIICAEDNNFYLYGNIYPDQYTSKPILIKTDSIGNEIWRNSYNVNPNHDGDGISIIRNKNNEFILVTYVTKNEYQQLSYQARTWITKIDSAGNILDEYKTPNNNRWILATEAKKTKDGGIIFLESEGIRDNNLGWDYEHIGYIAKIDSNFQLVWEKRYGQVRAFFSDVIEKENGDLLVSGLVTTNFLPDSVQYSGWLMALDANGDSLWERKYHDLYDAAYPYHAILDLKQLDDGRLLMAGYMNNIRANSPKVGE